ncbi:MAG TPA: hypothetical protein VK648_12310 [Gemmatimonadaceae bacterium]|nr:MAG: hypothetical protein DMF56_08890 [Acidobacteriota bacterium]HTD84559.1 hypothetical protein [Gemmatimonadaceae bacterium]
MRVAASSGAWIGAAFTFAAFGMGFLMLISPIPHDIALGLAVVFFVLAGIAGYGAWVAHYRTAHPTKDASAGAPILPDDSAAVAALREHTAALRQADWRARNAEIRQRVYGVRADLQSRVAELETSQRDRELNGKQRKAIIHVMSECMSEIRKWEKQQPDYDDDPQPVYIRITTIGTERETLHYRDEFIAAFKASGFDVVLGEWNAGAIELATWRGFLSVLETDPRNVVQPKVLAALKAAGLPVREVEFPSGRYALESLSSGDPTGAAHLVVGQRE